jgi:hypothetical protein
MTPSRKVKLSALRIERSATPPTKSARLIRPGGTIHVYPAVIWGVRLCQAEGKPIDGAMMSHYAERSLDLLRSAVSAYAWRERRKAMAR